MLTRIIVRNFKVFDLVEIELGNPVVFIGPNNSGKTTALQALALWELGLRRWLEKKAKTSPTKRAGVAINRRDLLAVPVPSADLLWRDLHVRDASKDQRTDKQHTKNVRIDITVEGVNDGEAWECGLEFDYANAESLYCRPLRLSEDKNPERMPIPETAAASTTLAFLHPMSGLAANETRLDPGAINMRVGEGRTAEVLRNLCHQIETSRDGGEKWAQLCVRMKNLFAIDLDPPEYVAERGEIMMTYRDRTGTRLDLSSSGRGLQQTLLLLAHMLNNPKSVLLLDEPDAHLEILRQRQIYQVLTDVAREQECQVIIASHSEVILNEAADRDVVVAFVGRPHRIDDRGSQVLKSLKEIGFDQYYQAEQTGWILYVEGATDLAILRGFAERLKHAAFDVLSHPFVCYVENQPQKARDHFYGIREAKPDLKGFALFDFLEKGLQNQPDLRERMWKRREIENYLCTKDTLLAWASDAGMEFGKGELFAVQWANTMAETIEEIESALSKLGKGSPWSEKIKASDDFLDPLFESYFQKQKIPNLLKKTDYHVLVRFVPRNQIDTEVVDVLDEVVQVASTASPRK